MQAPWTFWKSYLLNCLASRMSSICEDCLISYCSCSISPRKLQLEFQNLPAENDSLCTVTSLTNTIRVEDMEFQGASGHIRQDCMAKMRNSSHLSPLQDFEYLPGSNCCHVHSRCLLCNRFISTGSLWKRSVKRKIVQISREEELDDVLTNVMLLTQGVDMRDCDGACLIEKCQSPTHHVKDMEGTAFSASVNGMNKDKWFQGKFKQDNGYPTYDKQDEVKTLKEALKVEHEVIQALYVELEEERKAAADAAEATMALISRLQKEKAAVEMEARQYQQMVEEKALYDQETISQLKGIVLRKEEETLSLVKEVKFYQETLSSDRAKTLCRSRNMYGLYSSEREREMLTLNHDFCLKDDHSPFQNAKASLYHTMPSVPLNPNLFTNELWPTDESYNDLSKSSKVSIELEEKSQSDKKSFADFTYRISGNKLIDSFNSAACQSDELSGLCTQQVQKEGRLSECMCVKHGMNRRCDSFTTDIPMTSSEFSYGIDAKNFETCPVSTRQWRTNTVEEEIPFDKSPSDNALKKISMEVQSAIDTFSRGSPINEATSSDGSDKRQELFKETCKISLEKQRESRGNNMENFTIKERYLDWKGSCLADVHDVFEVQHDHHEEWSAAHPGTNENLQEKNEQEFLERFGNTRQNDSVPFSQRSLRDHFRRSPTLSPPDIEFFSERMESSAKFGHLEAKDFENPPAVDPFSKRMGSSEKLRYSEAQSFEKGLMDIRMRERLGKPEPMFRSTELEHQGERQTPGLKGKRKKTSLLSEKESMKCYADGDISGVGVEDKVKQLTLRLQALEADRESLKQTILSLKQGNGEMRILQDISQQMRELRRAEREVKDAHEATFGSIFKGISFKSLRRALFSQLGKLAFLLLRGAHSGAGLGDPVGLTHVLANRVKLQPASCVTRGIKADIILPGLANPIDNASQATSICQHITEWPRSTLGISDTALNGWAY